jgi:ABC-type glutathione transport system ATPase component
VARGLTALNLDWSGRLPRLRYRLTYITAVDRISLSIDTGETLGLVGESGCGKSTLGRLLLRLIKASSGTVEFAGVDVQHLNGRALRRFRQGTQIVFQNADSSLNPRLSVAEAIGRPLYLFNGGTSAERERRVLELLDMVQLPRSYSRRYPFQLSGGERQRVAIARALATRPRFIVCDDHLRTGQRARCAVLATPSLYAGAVGSSAATARARVSGRSPSRARHSFCSGRRRRRRLPF